MPKKNKPNQVVMLILLQGRPLAIMDSESDGENLMTWPTIDAAREATCSEDVGIGIRSAEQIVIVDMATGETETL